MAKQGSDEIPKASGQEIFKSSSSQPPSCLKPAPIWESLALFICHRDDTSWFRLQPGVLRDLVMCGGQGKTLQESLRKAPLALQTAVEPGYQSLSR